MNFFFAALTALLVGGFVPCWLQSCFETPLASGLWHTLASKSLVESRRRSASDVDLATAVALVGSLWHVCVGHDAEQSVVGVWVQAYESVPLIAWWCTVHSRAHPAAIRCCTSAPAVGTHLREGAREVVGVELTPPTRVLKAAVVCVLGKWQCRDQANQRGDVHGQMAVQGRLLDEDL
jgi:hypothetical protein